LHVVLDLEVEEFRDGGRLDCRHPCRIDGLACNMGGNHTKQHLQAENVTALDIACQENTCQDSQFRVPSVHVIKVR